MDRGGFKEWLEISKALNGIDELRKLSNKTKKTRNTTFFWVAMRSTGRV
jgi:hypothetical protein